MDSQKTTKKNKMLNLNIVNNTIIVQWKPLCTVPLICILEKILYNDMISPVKYPNYILKNYSTDYFTDVIHPCLHSLQSKLFQFNENYFCIHQEVIGDHKFKKL
jgi:hypothetical protein